jgi:hypothetical protein
MVCSYDVLCSVVVDLIYKQSMWGMVARDLIESDVTVMLYETLQPFLFCFIRRGSRAGLDCVCALSCRVLKRLVQDDDIQTRQTFTITI